MASIVKDAFQELWKDVESVVLRLLESESNQSELIRDEIRAFSAKLDSVWACHLVQSPVISPAAKTATDGLSSSHLFIQPVDEAASSSGGQETGIASLAIAASNLSSENQEPADAPDYPTRPHNSLRDADQASEEPNPGTQNQSLLGFRPRESSAVQESYQATSPVELFTPNREQFQSRSATTPLADSPRTNENSTVSIAHEVQDGVIRLLPTIEEWHDFPKLLQYARDLGAEKAGVCKVLLPEGVPGRTALTRLNTAERRRNKYLVHPQGNGIFQIESEEVDAVFPSESGLSEASTANQSSAKDLARRFEQLLESDDGLKGVTYCVDIDVRKEASRARLGLPSRSPIWPLKGDRLCNTKMRVPGIHWPYLYQSSDAFGAPFTFHLEDCRLVSVNYLYTGEKIWIILPPESSHLLEQKLKASNGSLYPSNCAQFLRHSATHISHTTLSGWDIPYSLVHQKTYEAIITFPEAYHGGFNAGYTIAEAVNYADAHWSIDGYRFCKTRSCPAGFIERKMMCWRREDEEQREQEEEISGEDECCEEDNEDEDQDQDQDEGNDNYSTTDSDKNNEVSGTRHRRIPKGADGVSSKPISTGKGLKRKSNEQGLGFESSKRVMKRLPFDASSSVSFEELQHISQGIIQPAEVYQTFIQRSNSEDENGLWLLTRLFFAIASPDAFHQLRDACTSVRRKADVTVPQHLNTVAQTVEALDNLETAASINAILRRYHLICLVEHRNERESQHKTEKPERATRNLRTMRQQEGFARASSMALADIMAEAYPGLEQPSKQSTASNTEYQRRYKTLKNRLCSGRNWHLMQQRFSPGILALVPTGGDYGVQSYEVEKLPVPLFTMFLDVLAELRGDFLQQVGRLVSQRIHDILYRRDLSWKYVFEKMDGDSLKKEPLDSPGFIRFCGLE